MTLDQSSKSQSSKKKQANGFNQEKKISNEKVNEALTATRGTWGEGNA